MPSSPSRCCDSRTPYAREIRLQLHDHGASVHVNSAKPFTARWRGTDSCSCRKTDLACRMSRYMKAAQSPCRTQTSGPRGRGNWCDPIQAVSARQRCPYPRGLLGVLARLRAGPNVYSSSSPSGCVSRLFASADSGKALRHMCIFRTLKEVRLDRLPASRLQRPRRSAKGSSCRRKRTGCDTIKRRCLLYILRAAPRRAHRDCRTSRRRHCHRFSS